MISFKDFVPEIEKQGGFFTMPTIADLSESLQNANDWIAANNVEVINVETVVLPNIHAEDGSVDTQLRTSGEMSTYWYQLIRVWHR